MNDQFDPYDLDKEEFNPDLSMLRMIGDCSLQQILSRNNHLDMEIKGIAAGIQNMLYDNYTKFITASEVISKIKNDFEKMEEDIQALECNMSSIENLSTQVVKSLQPTKDKRLKLIKTKESVNKLTFVVNLIPKLKEHIEQGDFTIAAKHYMKAKNLLEQYKNSKSLKGIIDESKAFLFYIREKLKNKLDCSLYSKEEISETMNLIIDLGEAKDEMLQFFLRFSKDILNKNIQKMRQNLFYDVEGSEHNAIIKSNLGNCSEYWCTYLDIVSKVAKIVQEVFSEKPFALHCSSILEDFVENNTQELFLLAGAAFQNQLGNMNDECLSNSLDQLYRKCFECNTSVRKFATFEKSAEAILYFCNDICDYHLHRMKQDFQEYFQCLEKKVNSEHISDDLFFWMDTVVHDIFMNTLRSLCHFISPEHKYSRNAYFRKNFCKLLAREKVFVSFLQDMNDDVLKGVLTRQNNEEGTLKMYLLLTKYMLQLYKSKARNFLNLVDEWLHSSSDGITLTPVSDIANKCKETAEILIGCYIETRQRRMSDMFRHSMENKIWMMAREPWKVSAAVRRVLEEFYATVKETEVSIECTKSSVHDKSSDSGKSSCLSSLSRTSLPEDSAVDDRMTVRIQKLFSKESAASEAVEFSSGYILNHIVKMTLKSLLEYIRQRTFNRFGLQQIQVDVHCLELHVSQCVRDERDVDVLLNDIISSCYTRTIDPEFMNPHVVSALCQAFSI